MYLAKNIAAFVNLFGPDDPDLIMSMASIPWQSADDRNGFINELVNINNGDLLKKVDGNASSRSSQQA
jgi:hypothetical protein